MQKVALIHGYTGNPHNAWFPWLQEKLCAQGIEVIVPQMPEPDKPQLEKWLEHLSNLNLGNPDNIYMVGHSLGCSTILRYAERLPMGQKLAGAILVAGFAESIGVPSIDNFLTSSWDDKKIKSSIDKLFYYNADNDPYVPLPIGKNLKKRFGGEFVEVHAAGHFSRRYGYVEFPVLYDKLKELMQF